MTDAPAAGPQSPDPTPAAAGAAANPDATAAASPRLAVRVLGGLVLLGVSALIALVAGEVIVRVAAPQQLIQIRPDLWQPADTVGWTRRPDVDVTMNTGERTVRVRTDRDGFRVGAEGRRDAPTQVLLVGDSFVEALQVEYEQTFGALLEQRLSDSLRRPVAVRNAGIGGWNPNHYFLRARDLLARERYALVVAAVFVGNDAVDRQVERIEPRTPVERHHFRLPRALSGAELRDALLAPVNDMLEVRSHLYILFKNQLSTVRMRLGLTADYLPQVYQRADSASIRWATTARISRALADAAAAQGVPVIFVLIPERFQVYDEEFRRYLAGFGVDPTTMDVDQPTQRLLAAFRAEGLHVLDALPAFRSAPADDWLYGRVDQHFSPSGHAMLADLLAREALPLMRP